MSVTFSPGPAPGPAPAAADVRQLFRGEHLVLLGFRALALGHAECPTLRRTFESLLGSDADDALAHMLTFVRVLGSAGARPVRLHAPGCCGVSADERRVLAAVAAGQSCLYALDEAPLRDSLEALLGSPPSEACLFAAQAVGAALTLSGLELPVREAAPTEAPPSFGGPTLH